jgi:hypothetical protein
MTVTIRNQQPGAVLIFDNIVVVGETSQTHLTWEGSVPDYLTKVRRQQLVTLMAADAALGEICPGLSVAMKILRKGELVMAKLHARPSNQYRYEHYDPWNMGR